MRRGGSKTIEMQVACPSDQSFGDVFFYDFLYFVKQMVTLIVCMKLSWYPLARNKTVYCKRKMKEWIQYFKLKGFVSNIFHSELVYFVF